MDSNEIFHKMSQILTAYLRLAPGEVTRASHVVKDLVELGFKMTEAFDIGMVEPKEELLVVGNLADHIASLKQA